MKSFILMLIAIIIISIVTVPVIIGNVIRKIWQRRDSVTEYFKIIASGFDQAGGSILYSQEDWMVSSWTYHLHRKGNKYATYFMRFIDFLFWDKCHCENSFFKEAAVLKFKAEWM